MTSTTTMITRLHNLLGTNDLSEWEQGFVASMKAALDAGRVLQLTEKQVLTLESIHGKHFA